MEALELLSPALLSFDVLASPRDFYLPLSRPRIDSCPLFPPLAVVGFLFLPPFVAVVGFSVAWGSVFFDCGGALHAALAAFVLALVFQVEDGFSAVV